MPRWNRLLPAIFLIILILVSTGCSLPSLSSPTPGLPPNETVPLVTESLPPSVSPEFDTPTTVWKPPLPPVSPEFDPALLGTVKRNLVYCTMDGVDLRMDLYFPVKASSAWPAVMYIHGGGLTGGGKSSGTGTEEIPVLVEAGFLTVAIDYRLAPEYQIPAMIEDVRCAVRHLRAHAGEYNIDPDRIGAYGGSAGGYLAALLGTSDADTGWDVGEYLEQSSRIQAVVDFYGLADLIALELSPTYDRSRLEIFGARDGSDPILVLASPVTYITPDDPPFLIIHGDQDMSIPLAQSQELFERLQETKVASELVIVHNAGHSFAPSGDGPMSPSREEITQMTVAFFIEQLQPQTCNP